MIRAALLALVVALVWPSDGSSSASPYTHGAGTVAQTNHDYGTLGGEHRVLDIDLDADCDASGIGCCVMMLCHPGISVDPHDMPLIVSGDDTTAAAAVRGVGRDPGVVPPPPRSLPICFLKN